MTPAEFVIDASVVVRGLLGQGDATEIVRSLSAAETRGHAPDLVDPESVNAFLRLARASRLDAGDARRLVDATTSLPVQRHQCGRHARAALELAGATGLSGYDAFYAVLAEALAVPLLTADRRLAAAVPGGQLVG